MSKFHNAIEKMKTSKKPFSDFFLNFIQKTITKCISNIIGSPKQTVLKSKLVGISKNIVQENNVVNL